MVFSGREWLGDVPTCRGDFFVTRGQGVNMEKKLERHDADQISKLCICSHHLSDKSHPGVLSSNSLQSTAYSNWSEYFSIMGKAKKHMVDVRIVLNIFSKFSKQSP